MARMNQIKRMNDIINWWGDMIYMIVDSNAINKGNLNISIFSTYYQS